MPVDIRATVSCSLGTVISGNVNDDYVQGTGLIKCSGTVLINGIITPAIGTAVTFSYAKGGVTRSIPRKLRVLSSFADPFRRTTSIELGCKLTYLSDKRDSIDWTAFDDEENTLTEADAEIITIPIRAQAVAQKCMAELGITGTFTLTNKFSIAEFDLSPGYVQVLSDLLVSESLCGYLDANETLQVFSLNQSGGTGPVLDATQLVDISKIGVGQLPGEAVTVSYSTLKLKREVSQTGGTGGGSTETTAWTRSESSNVSGVIVPWTGSDGAARTALFNVSESTVTITDYGNIRTDDGKTQRLPVRRTTTYTTLSPAVIGNLFSSYYSNGISISASTVQKVTVETFSYDSNGREVFSDKLETGGIAFLFGGASIPLVFSPTDYVSFSPNSFIELGRETRGTIYVNRSSQVTTRTYGHWFRTIQGQQAIAEGRLSFTSSSQVADYINALVSIGLLEINSTTEIQTTGVIVSAPSTAAINNANNANGGNPNNGYRTESKASLELALGSATAQRRIELSLPYAPDDTFVKVGTVYSSVESDAAQKAQLYGTVQNRLLLGNRNGMNIQAAPEILPAAPFSPFVIRSGSTSALYRTNGTNWTFDASGLVASTDALFLGGIGGNAGESWFPIAPGITTLPTTPGTTTVNIVDLSGNIIGSYEQMIVGNTVPVYQETRLLQATLRVRPVIEALGYALQQEADLTATIKLQASVVLIKAITPPVAAVTVAGLTPVVSTGARVAAPAAALAIEALTPVVASGASVQVPAADLTVAAVAPDLVGRQKLQLAIPAADVTVAGLVPLVASGASISVPAADVTVAGLVPSALGVSDPFFSSVSLLLHMDGSSNSTTFTDNSSYAHTITAFGGAKINTTDPKFGTGAFIRSASSDYLQTPSHSSFQLGTGSFTVELWVYLQSGNQDQGLFTFGGTSSGLAMGIDGSELWVVTTGGDPERITGGSIAQNTWTHVAVTRQGSSMRAFVNGSQVGSTYASSENFTDNQLKIGYGYSTQYGVIGKIDELRVTKGVARYTANFTPSTAPFPNA